MRMPTILAPALLCCLVGAALPIASAADGVSALAAARSAFTTKLVLPNTGVGAAPQAPQAIFRTLTYPSPVGALSAYLTPDPKDGKRHPAIIWITGGDCNSIDDVWVTGPRSNEQSASAFRRAGIVAMYPSLRGGNNNPGHREAFYGETQDILAAADFLAHQAYVDPDRIYLGGHSTGGTLVLLTAEVSSRFRAVFSFGPVGQANVYSKDIMPVDFQKLDPRESRLRWPEAWLGSVNSRVFVLEGEQGNIDDLKLMKEKNVNSQLSFVAVPGANHFNILAPATELLAAKIVKDTGSATAIAITAQEIIAAMK